MTKRLQAALAALIQQIELGPYRDDLGHDLRLNKAFCDAKALLKQG